MLGKVCKFGEMFSSSRPKCIMIISRKLENLLVEEKKNEDKKSQKNGETSAARDGFPLGYPSVSVPKTPSLHWPIKWAG